MEDLYRPYRPKRRTRASIAKEKGLEPLANYLMSFPKDGNVLLEAAKYISEEKEVSSAEEALCGAQDIVAELVSDHPDVRGWVRQFMTQHGILVTTAKDSGVQSVYEMYYEYNEPVKRVLPHRVLAINRGEREEYLKVKIEVDEERILTYLYKNG